MHSGVLFGLTVLLGHLCVCSGVKCYTCVYSTVFAEAADSNPNCDEGAKFNGQNLTDKTTECSGQCYKLRGGGTNEKSIKRGCYTVCKSVNGASQGLFCCGTDLCNDSWRMKASLTGAVASVWAALLLLKA